MSTISTNRQGPMGGRDVVSSAGRSAVHSVLARGCGVLVVLGAVLAGATGIRDVDMVAGDRLEGTLRAAQTAIPWQTYGDRQQDGDGRLVRLAPA